jgi:polysaccharide export outer membrane protein
MGLLLAGCHSGASSDSRFADLPGVTEAPAAAPTSTSDTGTPAAPVPAPTASGAQAAATAAQNAEMLKIGDTLNIVYSDLPLQVPPFDGPIKEDGSITLIYNKTFQAAGKTPGQLEKEIHEAYVPNIFKYMTVTVTHKDLTRFYYVGGEVKQPGREPYIGPTTLLRAIQTAGDFTDFAKKRKVQVTRGSNKVIYIDCIKARTHPDLDIDIYPGDKIHVPRRIF